MSKNIEIYVIKINNNWFESISPVGFETRAYFTYSIHTCKIFKTLEEAEWMCELLNSIPNALNGYKGEPKVHKYIMLESEV